MTNQYFRFGIYLYN